MDDSAYFVFGLLGLFAGYVVGDVQREYRWRGDAKRLRALAVEPLPGDGHPYPNPYANGDGGGDGSNRNGQARRLAVHGDNHRTRSAARVRGGDLRQSAPASLMAGHDCG